MDGCSRIPPHYASLAETNTRIARPKVLTVEYKERGRGEKNSQSHSIFSLTKLVGHKQKDYATTNTSRIQFKTMMGKFTIRRSFTSLHQYHIEKENSL
jgi:hypothetical protein